MTSTIVEHAKRVLARAQASTEPAGKPDGITTIGDIVAAEGRLAAAQAELRDYQNGTEGLRETLDKEGRKGLVTERYRYERIEHLQARVESRSRDLATAKRNWLEGQR